MGLDRPLPDRGLPRGGRAGGTCAAAIGLVFGRPGFLVAVALIWGFTIIADSAQFSASVTELAPPAYVGTALSLQTSLGFLLTLASTWLVPRAAEAWGWPWAFAFLAPGPFLGTLAMSRLRRLPESARIVDIALVEDQQRLAGGRR